MKLKNVKKRENGAEKERVSSKWSEKRNASEMENHSKNRCIQSEKRTGEKVGMIFANYMGRG